MTDVFSMMMDMLDTGQACNDYGMFSTPISSPVSSVASNVVSNASSSTISSTSARSQVRTPSMVAASSTVSSAVFTDMQDRLAEVLALQAPRVEPVIAPVIVPVARVHDEYHNILCAESRARFMAERVYYETYLFTAPINTTNTTSGYLTNVDFLEEELIVHVSPDENIVVYRCNYGKEVYCGYVEPVRVKKTNRGRKKKEKKKKPRKKQGNGTDFNSQMTFIVKSTLVDAPDGIVPTDALVYKIKVFRNGKIQLPGMARDSADDAIACAQIVCNELNHLLHAGAELTKLQYLNPVMKNYRMRVRLDELGLDGTAMVNLTALKDILAGDKLAPHPDAPPHPDIFDVKYDDGETKLSIKFSTPIASKATKKTRVNLMTRGKINILGAFDAGATFQICDYLHWLFQEYFDRLIIVEGGTRHTVQIADHEDNISEYIPPVPLADPSIDRYVDELFREVNAADVVERHVISAWLTRECLVC